MALFKNLRPKCKNKKCFACINGDCIALQYNDLEAADGGYCAFFKTEEEYRKGLKDYPPTLDSVALMKYESSRRSAKAREQIR